MSIDVVSVLDACNPQELRDWFNNHPNVNVTRIMDVSGYFYIFYE